MQSEPFQILLSLPNCSGRAVRLRAIGPEARNQASLEASRLVDDTSDHQAMGQTFNNELLKRTIVAVTKKTGLQTQDQALQLSEADWLKTGPQEFETDPERSFDALFTARDIAVLNAIAMRLYHVADEDVDAIMGKALSISC